MLRKRLSGLAAALWWGSLTVVGFMVVPMLFANLPNKVMAGNVAGQLFAVQTWISIACSVFILVVSRSRGSEIIDEWAKAAIVFAISGLLCALVQQYGVAPKIIARQDLAFWHKVGSGLYLVQWICAFMALWRLQSR